MLLKGELRQADKEGKEAETSKRAIQPVCLYGSCKAASGAIGLVATLKGELGAKSVRCVACGYS